MKIFELCQYCIRWTNYVPPARWANQLHFLFCCSPDTKYLCSRQRKAGYIVSIRDLRKGITGNEINYQSSKETSVVCFVCWHPKAISVLELLRQCSSIHTFKSPV